MPKLSITERLVSAATVLDTDDRAKYGLLFLQALTAGSATLHEIDSARKHTWMIVFCLAVMCTVLWSLFVIALRRRYGLNVLVYDRVNGILKDKTMSILNVALRQRTASIILGAILGDTPTAQDVQRLRHTGHNVGRDFVSHLRQQSLAEGRRALQETQLLATLLSYDSSSGWGKLEAAPVSGASQRCCRITVINPFTLVGENPENLTHFLVGYLEGVCTAVFDSSLEAREPWEIVTVGTDVKLVVVLDEVQ